MTIKKKEAPAYQLTAASRGSANTQNWRFYVLNSDSITRSKVPVYLADGRVCGWFEGTTFVKPVAGSKHKLRQPPAWAIDADVFEEQVRPNAAEIIVLDNENGKRYRTSVVHFDEFKGTLDRGFGRQYFLVLSKWEVIDPHAPRQLRLLELSPC